MKNKKFLFLAILFLVVGFATLSTSLFIVNKVRIASNEEDFDIYFSEAILDGTDLSDTIISADGKSISFTTTNPLKEVGDKNALRYKVTNNSTQYDASVEVSCVPIDHDYVTVTNDIIPTIVAKSMAIGNLTIELINGSDHFEDFEFTCNVVANAVPRSIPGTGPIVDPDPERPELPETTVLTGYMVDEEEHAIPNATLVAFSDYPKFVEADETGRLFINGLEIGTHELYYFEEDIDKLRDKTKEEIVDKAVTHTTFTTSTKNETVEFPNGYKIQDFYILASADQTTYEIYFDANGGNVAYSEKQVHQNGYYGELPIPTRAGYNFAGWFYNDKEIKANLLVVPDSPHTLVAKWVGLGYQIKFDSQGGSIVSNRDIVFGEAYGTLPVPTLEGYTFKGWFESTDYDKEILATDLYSTVGTQILYAKWEANDYEISFDTNGGSSVENITATFNDKYNSLPTSIKEGYDLTWCLDKELKIPVNNETIVDTADNHTLYAKWTKSEYQLSYEPNGGTLEESGKTITYDEPFGELPTPRRDGYRFIGWFTNLTDGEEITSATIVKTTSSIVLYAHWEALNYTISFDANGGDSVATTFTVSYGSQYGETFPVPTREGYSFDGWFDASTGGNMITTTSIVSILDDQTLYAHWTINQYDFIINKGTGIDTIYYKEVTTDGTGTLLTATTNLTNKYDFNTEFIFYATAATGYWYDSCTIDSPCSGRITTNGLSYNPVATKVTASMISFDDSIANLGCSDVQCALTKLDEKIH